MIKVYICARFIISNLFYDFSVYHNLEVFISSYKLINIKKRLVSCTYDNIIRYGGLRA